jgi:hypothetical protein
MHFENEVGAIGAGELKREHLSHEAKKGDWINSRLLGQIFLAANVLKRAQDHLFDGAGEAVWDASAPSAAIEMLC